MSIIRCEKCNTEYDESYGICPQCGTVNAARTAQRLFCGVCGSEVEDVGYCKACGNRMTFGTTQPPIEKNQKSKQKSDPKRKKMIIATTVCIVVAIVAVAVLCIVLFGGK